MLAHLASSLWCPHNEVGLGVRFKWTDLRVWLSANPLVLHENKLGFCVPVIPVNNNQGQQPCCYNQPRLITEAVPPSLSFSRRWWFAGAGEHTPITHLAVILLRQRR